ncbi:hypothetical protein VH569_30620 [Azospirillum sp. 11R-A]|uniref:hypothetical protein n=1 Tax=Azospirillum sp. 11R-A TaxID=3111634 RepID=UPI003C1FAC6A
MNYHDYITKYKYMDKAINKRNRFSDIFILLFAFIFILLLMPVSFIMLDDFGLISYAPMHFSFWLTLTFSVLFFLPSVAKIFHIQLRIALVIVGTALVTAALSLYEHILENGILEKIEWAYATIPRLFAFFIVVGGMLWTAHALREPIKQSIRRRWWNMGALDSSKAPDWDGILDMLCNDSCDPMELEEGGLYPVDKNEVRIDFSVASTGSFFLLLAVGTIFGIAIDYILYPRLPTIFEPDEQFNKLASLSGNLTAFLALIAAAISIVFTYQQLQAKVRADSRQAWVTKVRKLTSNVLAHIYDVSMHGRSSNKFEYFNKARTHLELHLNPAEKDHRLLMLLIRACGYPETTIFNDQYTAYRLASKFDEWSSSRKDYYAIKECTVLKLIIETYKTNDNKSAIRRRIIVRNNSDIVISFVFKLSHAILKREWERVRYIR